MDASNPAKARIAGSLIDSALKTGKGIVSYQVVQEFFHVALKKFAKPITAADAEQYIATVFRPLWSVQPSPGLFVEGLRIHTTYGFAWYDSLIVAAATKAECSILYTEDLQHNQLVGSVRITNPFIGK
jgi:predicted nucleic acid-binding protein